MNVEIAGSRRGGAVRPSRTGFLPALLLVAAWLAALAVPARADVAGAVGADYYSGPSDQVTRGVLGVASVGVAGGFASLAGVRFDDNLVGAGFSVTGGAGAPLGSPSRLFRVLATRFVGDASFRAWRLKAGPFFQWGGSTLGLSFLRYVDDQSGEATGGIAELEVPVAPRWKATASGSAAAIQAGERSWSGSAGIAWTATPHVTLTAEAGVARNGSIASAAPASAGRGLRDNPVLGNLLGGGGGQGGAGAASETTPDVSATLLMGIRVPIP